MVDALEERIDLTNDLDQRYQQAHVTAMLMKRAYAIVGSTPNVMETEYPLVTIESPQEVHVGLDPATRQVVAAIKR